MPLRCVLQDYAQALPDKPIQGAMVYTKIYSPGNTTYLDGISASVDYGAGTVCFECIMSEYPTVRYMNLAVMLGSHAEAVAAGQEDARLEELARIMKAYPDVTFYVRIGYEFDARALSPYLCL